MHGLAQAPSSAAQDSPPVTERSRASRSPLERRPPSGRIMDMRQPFNDFLDAELHASIADQGSVRLAAAACGISQPAASRRLRLMEHRVGVPLYKLSTKGAHLSAAGLFWEIEARNILANINEAANRFSREYLGATSRLKIAAGQVVADHLLPTWLLRWTSAGDERLCDIEVGNYTFVRDRVGSGEAELGLLELRGDGPVGFRSVPLLADRLVLVVSPLHRLARRKAAVTLDELARMPLIQRESDSGTLLALTQMLKSEGHQLADAAIEVGSASAVKSAVTRGLAPAVVPRISVIEEIESGGLVEVPVDEMDLPVTVYAISRRANRLSTAARTFISSVLECVQPVQSRR